MSLDIIMQRTIDATADEAFRMWTDAAAREQWYAPADGFVIEASTDLRVGGAWSVTFGTSREEMYTESGVFTEVDPPRKVSYSSIFRFPDGREFETFVTVTFEQRDGKTELTLVDAGFPNEEQKQAHENGWPAFLNRFAAQLATAHR